MFIQPFKHMCIHIFLLSVVFCFPQWRDRMLRDIMGERKETQQMCVILLCVLLFTIHALGQVAWGL